MNATIIIPTYNALEYTKKCLSSLKLSTRFPYNIIIVDNGSTDGTREYIEKNKYARLIKTKSNLGYAGACNVGMQTSNSKYIILSNNDILFTPGWLSKLIETAELNSRIGLVGPITNLAAGSHKEMLRSYKTDSQMLFQAAELRKINHGLVHEVPWLVFFCTLIKRSVYEKIGLLDDSFGLGGHDDLDYSMRARSAGYCCVIDRSVFVHHYCSITYKSNKMEYNRLLSEARKKFCDKWGLPRSPL